MCKTYATVARMPSVSTRTRFGTDSKRITSRMRASALLMRLLLDASLAGAVLGVSKDTIRTTIRIIESKTGWRLFVRARGRQTSTWQHCEAADAFFLWLETHPTGGDDWPSVAKATRRSLYTRLIAQHQETP